MDLYRKKTDRNMYLLTSSCHPNHVTSNIPYSLALRIVRICSETSTRNKRLEELKQLLLQRDYKTKIIDAAIAKAKKIPRSEALKKVERDKTNERPVFVVTYDPRYPSINNIVKKHWRSATTNPTMKAIFPKPPLIAYKRPQTIGDKLLRAKLPSRNTRPRRIQNGMFPCNKPCYACPYVKKQKVVKSSTNNTQVQMTKHHTCEDKNICYIIECKKCGMQYIGESQNSMKERFSDHVGYVRRKEINKATGQHFNLPGHSQSDMTVSVLERIHSQHPQYRKTRESFHIEQFELLSKGINRKR